MTNQKAIEIITNAVQTEKMTIEQDKALAGHYHLVQRKKS